MNQELEQFKNKVHCLSAEESDLWRSRYVAAFVRTDSSYFRERIATRRLCSDGECYSGYLWDTLKAPEVISLEDLPKYLPSPGTNILVFWDIHSRDHIHVPDYWKFAKTVVLEMPSEILLSNRHSLPEDLYVFDRSLSWSVILTHETDLQNEPYVLKASL